MKNHIIFVCNSMSPKLQGVGCCGQKDASIVLEKIQEWIESKEVIDEVGVKFANCISHCHTGLSVKIAPKMTLYGNVKSEDVEELLESHILKGEVLERLHIIEENRFLGF